MAFADFQTKQKQNKQKSIIREYFTKRNGQLLCLSDDPTILSLLRATVKEMGLPASELVVFVPDPSKLLKAITDSFAAHKRPALFIESVMSGSGETSFMVRQFKESFPDLRIFAMTTTSEKARIMLLYESGADNFIARAKRYTDIQELTPELLRLFIEKIVVHEKDVKWSKHARQTVEIHYTDIGVVGNMNITKSA